MPDTISAPIVDCPGGVTIRVYVSPRSSVNAVVGLHNGEIKIALTAPPVDGAANRALMEFVSRQMGVQKGAVSLLSGETSRHKVVRVIGVSVLEAEHRLMPVD